MILKENKKNRKMFIVADLVSLNGRSLESSEHTKICIDTLITYTHMHGESLYKV